DEHVRRLQYVLGGQFHAGPPANGCASGRSSSTRNRSVAAAIVARTGTGACCPIRWSGNTRALYPSASARRAVSASSRPPGVPSAAMARKRNGRADCGTRLPYPPRGEPPLSPDRGGAALSAPYTRQDHSAEWKGIR